MATGWYSGNINITATGEGTETITHGLSFVPDIIIGVARSLPVTGESYIWGGYSKRFMDMLKINDDAEYPPNIGICIVADGGSTILAQSTGIDEEPTSNANTFGLIRNWTDTTFEVGSEGYTLPQEAKVRFVYFWCDGELYGDGSVPTPLMLTSSINRGGYQIVDLANNEFVTGTAIQIPGIYALVDSNSKAVLLSGINLDGKTYNDLYVSMYKVDFKYTAKVYGKYIVIDEDDNVIFQDDAVTTTYIENEEDDI